MDMIELVSQGPDTFEQIFVIDSDEDKNDDKIDNSASVKNPNKDDPRRLFQVRSTSFQ